MKRRFSVVLFLTLCAVTAGVFCVYGEDSDESKCREFLKGYGWEVEKSSDSHAQGFLTSLTRYTKTIT